MSHKPPSVGADAEQGGGGARPVICETSASAASMRRHHRAPGAGRPWVASDASHDTVAQHLGGVLPLGDARDQLALALVQLRLPLRRNIVTITSSP